MTTEFEKLQAAAGDFVKAAVDIGGHISEPETLNTVRKNIYDYMVGKSYSGNFAPLHLPDQSLINMDNLLKGILSVQKLRLASGANLHKQITAVQDALEGAHLKYYISTSYERRNDRVDLFLIVLLVIILLVLVVVNLPAAAIFTGSLLGFKGGVEGVNPDWSDTLGKEEDEKNATDDLKEEPSDVSDIKEGSADPYVNGEDIGVSGGACHKCASKCGGPICNRCAGITLGGCGSCSNE